VTQRAREVAEGFSGLRFLIRDRDAKFSASFDAVFVAEGLEVMETSIRAPQANAICERAVGTLRRECVDHLLIFGRRQLQAVLHEYLVHYNSHRPHRSLRQRPPARLSTTASADSDAPILRRDRLGGLIHEYQRAA
jgi:transposase InsO family protein